MGKKINLPLLPDVWSTRAREAAEPKRVVKKPSLDDARNRLGGRTTDEEPAPPGISPGRIVKVVAAGGGEHVAVVVFANADEIHILIDGTPPPTSLLIKLSVCSIAMLGIGALIFRKLKPSFYDHL